MASSFAFKALCYAALLLPIQGADVRMNIDMEMNIDIANTNINYHDNENNEIDINAIGTDIDNDSEAQNGQLRIQVWIIEMRLDDRKSESANQHND